MGHNEYMLRVKELISHGYDFLPHKRPYKSETKLIKRSDWFTFPRYHYCIVTLWDDDSVTESCETVSEYSVQRGDLL